MDHRRRLGLDGEEAALKLLLDKGYKLVARNYRCKIGEIDLVVRDNSIYVFVEVRSKSSNSCGTGLESITFKKQSKLRMVATQFLARYGLLNEEVRFDVFAVLFTQGNDPVFEHLEGAF